MKNFVQPLIDNNKSEMVKLALEMSGQINATNSADYLKFKSACRFPDVRREYRRVLERFVNVLAEGDAADKVAIYKKMGVNAEIKFGRMVVVEGLK